VFVADAKTDVSGYAALLPTILATMRSSIDSSLPRYEPLADNINYTPPPTLAGLLHAAGATRRQREGTVDEPHEKKRRKCNRRKAATKVPKVPKVPKAPKPRPKSGFYGVVANNKRWQAQLYYDGKQHCLGTFDTKQEAALEYDRVARQQCGKAKPLNYEAIEAAEEAAAAAQAEHILMHGPTPTPPKPRPASGLYGVTASANGKRWSAQINYASKLHYLGTFDTKQEAALEYDRVARQQCGKARPLNYESAAPS
jgi:hypothetical protein